MTHEQMLFISASKSARLFLNDRYRISASAYEAEILTRRFRYFDLLIGLISLKPKKKEPHGYKYRTNNRYTEA